MITVLFFAKLSEQLNCRELQVDASRVVDTSSLFTYLVDLKPEWATTLNAQSWLTAVNQTMVSSNVTLQDGDEVAFFPPVTGG